MHRKKRLAISSSPAGMSLTRIIKSFPARESLVSGIPAGDGKISNLLYIVLLKLLLLLLQVQ
jgi:hypothetical protein